MRSARRSEWTLAASLRENAWVPHVSEPAIADLRAELLSFKQASGAQWACAAVQLAGAVEALLEDAESD